MLTKILFILKYNASLSKFPIFNFEKNNFIFIHINKCAGTSILNFFKRKKLHLTSSEIIKIVGANSFSKCIKFCVVRNPYDRVISHYFHRIKTNRLRPEVDINEWIHDLYDCGGKRIYKTGKDKMFKTQLFWLKNNNKINVDHVLKFENLDEDFKKFCNKCNVKYKKLPHSNSSNRFNVRLNKHSIDLINLTFHEDFQNFNYNKR